MRVLKRKNATTDCIYGHCPDFDASGPPLKPVSDRDGVQLEEKTFSSRIIWNVLVFALLPG